MNGILNDAGYYRNHPVRIVGSRTVTANYMKVPTLMDELIDDINSPTNNFFFVYLKKTSFLNQLLRLLCSITFTV